MAKKTNAQYLEELLITIKGLCPKEGKEAMEFFEEMKNDHETEIEGKEEKIKELEDEKEPEYDNESDLGLDTLKWSLENGNLAISELMENFIESVQKKYSVTTAHG